MTKKYKLKLVESKTGLSAKDLYFMRNCLSDLNMPNISLELAYAIIDCCDLSDIRTISNKDKIND